MPKHSTIQPVIIPGFDVLKWKQENQARIRRETAGMTQEEIRERRRHAVDRFDEEQRRRRVEVGIH